MLGVPIDSLDMAETMQRIREHVERESPGAHLGVNAANLVMARDRPHYLEYLAAADMVSADGQWVVWGARLLGIHIPERVTGIDLMQQLLTEARCRGWSLYLVGAREDVVRALVRRLQRSGLKVAGWSDGYFHGSASHSIAEAVKASGAKLLFVGLPSPQKERFIIRHARAVGVPFSVGVGGSFDVLAGRLRRAPRVLQRLGMEGFFRFAQEPRRLFGRHGILSARYMWLLSWAVAAHLVRAARR